MCACELGLDVGVEGHEYKVVEENLDAQHKSLVADCPIVRRRTRLELN